jgi:DNA-binding NarL/FixJ family response regulator
MLSSTYFGSMNSGIKLGIVEDQKEFAEYIENIMVGNSSIEKIYHWGSAEKYWRDEKGKSIDLLLLDIHLPGMNGVELASHVKDRNPTTKIVIVSANFSDELIFQALKNGAIGYILKSELKDLPISMDVVLSGGGVMSPSIAVRVAKSFQKAMPTNPQESLSIREKQILDEISNGVTAKSVAQKLAVSESTIRTHIRSIYEKLQVNSRAKMVKKAGELGLL